MSVPTKGSSTNEASHPPVRSDQPRAFGIPGEPILLAVGAAGLVVAVLCFVAVVVRGRFIPPEGKMWDATTFSFGVAVFTLTMALLVPQAGYSAQARRRWARVYCIFPIYGFVLEPTQAFRGIDPRFTEAGNQLDVVLGPIFAMTALLSSVLFVILALRFFRADVLTTRPLLRLGIRYGSLAVVLSFAVRVVMIAITGRATGNQGDLMLVHGLGVHAIQTVPLVALALEWADKSRHSTPWMHGAGIGWLIACTAALAQAMLGRPPFAASVLTMITLTGLTVWVVVAVHAVVSWSEWPSPARLLRRA